MNTQVYACYLNDREELEESSSGGAFTALTNVIFKLCGVVIACKYDYITHTLKFSCARNAEERDKMRGSKYIQADCSNLYALLSEELKKKENTPILIVGTPCQIAGVKSWVRLKNILTKRQIIYCDLICHGVSSPRMWKEYITRKEKLNNKKVKFITFKDKSEGWIRPTSKAILEDEKEISIEDYAMLYKSNDFMRKSCYYCKFSSVNRDTDITIGDFWSIQNVDSEFANMRGTSLVILHTKVGEKFFKMADTDLKIRKSTLTECIQPNMKSPTKRTKRYHDIQIDYVNYGIDYVIERYIHFGPGNSLVRKIRKKYFKIKYKQG